MVFSKGQIRFSICLIWSKSVHIEQRERVDGNPLKASAASSWNGQELLLFDKVTGDLLVAISKGIALHGMEFSMWYTGDQIPLSDTLF